MHKGLLSSTQKSNFPAVWPCHNSKLQARASNIWPTKKQCNAEHCELSQQGHEGRGMMQNRKFQAVLVPVLTGFNPVPSRAEEHCLHIATPVCAQQFWMCTHSVKQPHNKRSPKD